RQADWRSPAAILQILRFLAPLYKHWNQFFTEHPSLRSIFDHEFDHGDQFWTEEYILRLAYYLPHIFIRRPDEFPLSFKEDELAAQLASYGPATTQWEARVLANHEQMAALLAQEFKFPPEYPRLLCYCSSCLGQWQQQVYDFFMGQIKAKLALTVEQMQTVMQEDRAADLYFDLKADLDKLTDPVHRQKYTAKYPLARTARRIEQEKTQLLNQTFCYPAPLAKTYVEQNLKPRLGQLVAAQGIDPHLIMPEQYESFWTKLKLKLWLREYALKREFQKFVSSALAFKRHDISATILNAYLGEFWQQMEVRQKRRRIIYHMGPTNSGKTYHAMEALRQAKTGCYLAPLRLLAAEIYDTMNAKGTPTTLLTGEEVIEVPSATHVSSTVEMAKLHETYDCCVIDEIQMITDPQRGWAWTRALLGMNAPEIHVCGDNSVYELLQKIVILCGDTLEVKTYERMAAQVLEERPVILKDLCRSDALIAFSRRNVLKYKLLLENAGFKVSVVYGRLGPEVRREQARKFDQGETDVIVATDAIAM
ncbi:MAG: hypothetical protein J6Y94_03885, partial [Bacteriovoracaceae bacterium]|nr:hypothetical protein [Bacteriovoracaceae bacterium]